MRRLISTLLLVLTAVHHAQGEVNLALNKPVKQSSDFSSNRSAGNAVNGVVDDSNDFSRTAKGSGQWWQVDLEGNFSLSKIELYNRQGYYERLKKITFYTSTLDSPENPAIYWSLRYYQLEAYGAVGTKLLNRQIPARHVRFYCEAQNGLALQEVMVYEERIFITAEAASHSGQSSNNPASAAIDGDLDTFSTTRGSDSHWWKVTLEEKTLLKKAVVFAEINFANATYLTSRTKTDTEPNTSGSGGWTRCLYSEQALGEEYEVVCDGDYAYTKEFGIHSAEEEIGLKEVQMFGYELPQLNKDIDGQTDSLNATSVTVSFLQWNSDMVGEKPPNTYKVVVNDTKMFISHEPNQERLTATFTNLSPGTEYTVTVDCKIYEDYCLGHQHTFTTQTECAVPDIPVINEPICTKHLESARQRWQCFITWQIAENCLDSVTYLVDGVVKEETTSSNISIYVDGGQVYHIGIIAENSAGFDSNQTNKSWKTANLAPQFGSSTFNVIGINSSCVMLTWEEPEYPGGDIQTYQYNCTDTGWKNVTASVTTQQSCGHDPKTQVNCSLVALNGLVSLPISASGTTTSATAIPLRDDTPEKSSGTIAGAVVGTFLVIAIGCVAVYLVHRFHKPQQDSKTDTTEFDQLDSLENQPARNDTGHGNYENEARNIEQENDPAGLYSNQEQLAMRSEPILVERLGWFIKTNQDAINAQFSDLNTIPLPSRTVALQPENKKKCRYKDLYTADGHRVKLLRTNAQETDFINASFMKGYSFEVGYIASMGPFNAETSADFWLMIWQQKPSAIVMVTRTTEDTKMKCWQYWPPQDGKINKFGEFSIACRSTEVYPDFSLRYLEIENNGEKRMIPHFNYLTWPDHGIPDIEVFVAFHRLVKSTVHMTADQPLLVHCSAGVGRSGTFIALDYLLEQAKKEGKVDMYSCAAEMRRRRPSMIQTARQYILLHRALHESITTEAFSCSPFKIKDKRAHHQQMKGEKSDLISAEYLHILNRINALTLSYKSGKMPSNREKNRFSEILPCEEYMLFLTDGFDGNYINAVTVNGNRTKGKWIATQNPLSFTIRDFWELMVEQEVEVVVQLEGTQNPFYPLIDNSSLSVDPFTITRNSSKDGEHVKTVEIRLRKDAVRPKEKRFSVVMAKNWTTETLPPTKLIITLHEVVEKLLQQTGSTKICVVCQDGSTKCGLYICAHNAIEKLKADQVVDIYYPMVTAKLRRPQFVSTMGEYRYLYHVVDDFADEFGEYANFG